MNLTIRQLLDIAKSLKTAYAQYQAANADGKISSDEWLALIDAGLKALDDHGVTLQDLRAVLGEITPLLALLKA